MATLDTFLARLLPRAVGCEDPVARQALLDSAIEFCEETGVVQVVTDPMAAVANQPDYTLVIPAGTAVVTVRKAWYGSTTLTPAADDEIRNVLAYFDEVLDAEAPTGTPNEYFWHEDKLWLHAIPDESASLAITARVALKPAVDATALPDELLNHWREPIVDGALARIFRTRGTSNYDPSESDRCMTRFNIAKGKAKRQARTGRASGELAVRMRPFA